MKHCLLYLLLLIAGCNSKKSETENETSESSRDNAIEKANLTLPSGCYQMIIGKDTALMNVTVSRDSVTGSLNYKRFEKDSNTGVFSGKIENARLTGWYKFQSEGMLSVRQVIFKIGDNILSEGYGDLGAIGDTAYFKYPQALNYEEMHPFVKVECK